MRLAVLMLTLRAARVGTGNITGWLQNDAEPVLQQLVAADRLRLPGTVADAMASRSEDPTAITVPTVLPERHRPFAFGKTTVAGRGREGGTHPRSDCLRRPFRRTGSRPENGQERSGRVAQVVMRRW